MPKIIKCHPDWTDSLINTVITSAVEAFLENLRGQFLFKFIGKETTINNIASNIMEIKSGKDFIGTFQIIDDPSEGKILKIEFEKSGKKSKKLLWNNIFELIEGNLKKSPLDTANV